MAEQDSGLTEGFVRNSNHPQTYTIICIFVLFIAITAVTSLFLGRSCMKLISALELERITANEPFLIYRGLQEGSHRIESVSGRVFLVTDEHFSVPNAPAASTGIAVFLKIEGGRIRPLTACEISFIDPNRIRLFHNETLIESKFEHDFDLIPVIRNHGNGDPQILLLESDGDWSEEEIEGLDAVLAEWVRDALHNLEQPQNGGTDKEPSLRYDKDASSLDLKTLVIRVEGFRDQWCESLAIWLQWLYPFLGQIKTE